MVGAPATPGAPGAPPPPPPAGTATLNWTAPLTDISGNAIVIAGYNIYRLNPGVNPCPIDITLYTRIPPVPASGLATVVGSPAATTYTDTALVAGPYCYAVGALNIFGQESVPAFLATPITVS